MAHRDVTAASSASVRALPSLGRCSVNYRTQRMSDNLRFNICMRPSRCVMPFLSCDDDSSSCSRCATRRSSCATPSHSRWSLALSRDSLDLSCASTSSSAAAARASSRSAVAAICASNSASFPCLHASTAASFSDLLAKFHTFPLSDLKTCID